MKFLTITTLKVYLYDKRQRCKRRILTGDAVAVGGCAIEVFQNNDIRLTFEITKKKKEYEALFQRTDVLYSRNYAITLKMITVDDTNKEEKFTGRNENCVITDYYIGCNGKECIKAIMRPSLNGKPALELFEK